MTEAEFAVLLDRYGADRARWPAPDAERADDLLSESPIARRDLAAARAVDEWLAELHPHEAPAGLAESILERVHSIERVQRAAAAAGTERRPDPLDRADLLDTAIRWLTARLWRPVLVAALPVVAGFAIGVALPAETDTELASQIGTLAFVDIYEELDHAEQP